VYRLGVDLEGLLVSQPSNGEEGLKIAEMLVKSNAVDVIVIDSGSAVARRTYSCTAMRRCSGWPGCPPLCAVERLRQACVPFYTASLSRADAARWWNPA
jgi:hypothetical protein